jgi:zinc transporter ZupT
MKTLTVAWRGTHREDARVTGTVGKMNVYPILIGLALVTLVGALAGIRLAETPSLSQRALPFSGGLLVGIALFWILPEIAQSYGWKQGCAGLVAGFGLLWLVDRYVHPVCPSCSHTHDHTGCAESLHGFAAPLLIAAGVHNLFDGWSLAASQEAGFERLRFAFLAGIGFHKLPEGLALGALLLAAFGVPWKALLGAAGAQSMMVAGGALALVLGPHLGKDWTALLLSLAAGAFVYLGYHAIDSQYQRRRGAIPVVSALTGAVGAAALRLGIGG